MRRMLPSRAPAGVLALVLGVMGIVGVGAATGAIGGATAATAASGKWDPRLQSIADKVAELRQLKFEHPVAAEFLADAAFEKRIAIDQGKLT
jgi:hypothetical protein